MRALLLVLLLAACGAPREPEILRLITESISNKEAAARLGISVKTVEKHRQSLMTKLDIHDIAGLTRYAIRHEPGHGVSDRNRASPRPQRTPCARRQVTSP